MDKEKQQELLHDAFAEFASEYPQSALVLVTGLFVGLLEYNVEDQGGDKNREMYIDGGTRRDSNGPVLCGLREACHTFWHSEKITSG